MVDQSLPAAVLLAAVALRVAVNETSPYVQYPIFIGSGLLTLFALWRLYRSLIRPLAERVDSQERSLRRSDNDRAVIRWQYRKLVEFLQYEGVAIPDHVAYATPPRYLLPFPDQWEEDEREARTHERARGQEKDA